MQHSLKSKHLFLGMDDIKISGNQLVTFFYVEKVYLKPFLMLLKYSAHIFSTS